LPILYFEHLLHYQQLNL